MKWVCFSSNDYWQLPDFCAGNSVNPISAEDVDNVINEHFLRCVGCLYLLDTLLRVTNLEGRTIHPLGNGLPVLIRRTEFPRVSTILLKDRRQCERGVVIQRSTAKHFHTTHINGNTEIGRQVFYWPCESNRRPLYLSLQSVWQIILGFIWMRKPKQCDLMYSVSRTKI